jgi:hypothetical protein
VVDEVVVVDAVAEAVHGQPVQVSPVVLVLADDDWNLVELSRLEDVLGSVRQHGAVDDGGEPAGEGEKRLERNGYLVGFDLSGTLTVQPRHIIKILCNEKSGGQTERPKETDGQTERKQTNKWRNSYVDKHTCSQTYGWTDRNTKRNR